MLTHIICFCLGSILTSGYFYIEIKKLKKLITRGSGVQVPLSQPIIFSTHLHQSHLLYHQYLDGHTSNYFVYFYALSIALTYKLKTSLG